jgi:hypothetical protein
VGSELAALLDQSQQPDKQAEMEKRLLFVLSHHDATREWLFDYFKDKQKRLCNSPAKKGIYTSNVNEIMLS